LSSTATVSTAPRRVSVYDSAARGSRILEECRALWSFRSLVYELVIRDIKVRYKRSVLGIAWTMLAPLLNMVTMTIVFSALLKTAIANYPVYFLSGILFWNFVAQSTSAAALQVNDANDLARRTYLPRSVFLVASVGVALINLVLSLVPLLGIVLVTRYPIHATWLFLPVAVAIGAVFSLGLGFILFTLASRFSDIREMYLVLIQVWFFMTPIVYHVSVVPAHYRWPIWLNPMYYMVQTFRMPIYEGKIPGAGPLVTSIAFAVAVFVTGFAYFARRSDRFAVES
jgi:ABC-type polysaccharide/polyol phosphate export permease